MRAGEMHARDAFRPDAVVFDMDGLLVDSEPLWFEVEREFARARGGEFTEAHARACVGKGLASTLAFFSSTFGFATDAERDAREIVDAFVARARELRPKPGALALLDVASERVPVALASSSPERLIAATLGALGVSSRFDVVVSGERVARPKPAPDVFVAALDRLGVPAARAVVLEDSLAGATAGRAAGAYVVAVPEVQPPDPAFSRVADRVVSSLIEARACLDFAPGGTRP